MQYHFKLLIFMMATIVEENKIGSKREKGRKRKKIFHRKMAKKLRAQLNKSDSFWKFIGMAGKKVNLKHNFKFSMNFTLKGTLCNFGIFFNKTTNFSKFFLFINLQSTLISIAYLQKGKLECTSLKFRSCNRWRKKTSWNWLESSSSIAWRGRGKESHLWWRLVIDESVNYNESTKNRT